MILHCLLSGFAGAKASITWNAECFNHMVTPLLESYGLGNPAPPTTANLPSFAFLSLLLASEQHVWLVKTPECWHGSFNHMERAELQSHGYANALITWLRGCFNHMSPQRHPCDRSFPVHILRQMVTLSRTELHVMFEMKQILVKLRFLQKPSILD